VLHPSMLLAPRSLFSSLLSLLSQSCLLYSLAYLTRTTHCSKLLDVFCSATPRLAITSCRQPPSVWYRRISGQGPSQSSTHTHTNQSIDPTQRPRYL
jgi:hypothetical protein